MANETINRINQQFEKTVFGPFRSYATIVTDHAEAVASIQMEAVKAYTDLVLQQARAAADIRDAEGWKSYVAGQSKVAEQFSARVKGDAEKLASANQAFVQNAQAAAEKNVATARKAAEEGVETVKKAAAGAA